MQPTPRRATRWLLAFVLLVPLLATHASGQDPQGFGVSPARIDIPDAQPGQTYVRTLTVQNRLDSASTIDIEGTGLPGTWFATQPGDGFTVAARTDQPVQVTIQVPPGTAGTHQGEIRFTTERKGEPTGSGSGLRYAVSVPITVFVGGASRTSIAWQDVQASHVHVSEAPRATVSLVNDGNVRTTARLQASILGFSNESVLATASGEQALDPGDHGSITLEFAIRLPPGQYRMRADSLHPAGFTSMALFKVFTTEAAPSDGLLRGLRHEPRLEAGQALRIDGAFTNVGSIPVKAARLELEVHKGSLVVAELRSPEAAVAVGESLNLSAEWVPKEAGEYVLRGHVQYDGYQTPATESIVHASAGVVRVDQLPWLLISAAAGTLAILGAVGLARRGARR